MSGTDEDRHFKFGMQVDRGKYKGTKYNLLFFEWELSWSRYPLKLKGKLKGQERENAEIIFAGNSAAIVGFTSSTPKLLFYKVRVTDVVHPSLWPPNSPQLNSVDYKI